MWFPMELLNCVSIAIVWEVHYNSAICISVADCTSSNEDMSQKMISERKDTKKCCEGLKSIKRYNTISYVALPANCC